MEVGAVNDGVHGAMSQAARVLFCNCSYSKVVPPQVRQKVLEGLNDSGVEVEAVADLCELCARTDPAVKQIAQSGITAIVACYPRAVRWLFHAGGAPLGDERVAILNMREQSAEEIIEALRPDAENAIARVDGPREPVAFAKPGAWVPWFPVIDYDRCGNCKQCLSFCLFGVFGVDADDRVEVQNPDKCKTGCPACARVCPSVAIMFPKYGQRPVNGDVVRDEDVKREAVKVDVASLVSGDIRASLRARSGGTAPRFVPAPAGHRNTPVDEERMKEVQAELGIPDEVMSDLACSCNCSKGKCNRQPDQPPDAASSREGEEGKLAAEEEWNI